MNEFKVGLLALISLLSVGYMSFKVTSNQSGFGNYVTYKTTLRDASGIFPKTPIKVAGINAGRIKGISLEGTEALITFELLAKVRVPKDSKLKIKSVGFLGDKYLEVAIGNSTDYLEDGAHLEAQVGGGLEDLMKDAGDVLKDVKSITQGLKDSLAPENGENPVKTIIADLKATTSNAKDATGTLKRLLEGNEEKLNELISNLNKFSGSLESEFNRENNDSAISDINDILKNAKKASADLKEIMAMVKSGKGTIGKFLVEDKIADQVSQTLSGVNRLVNRVNSIRTEVNAYTGANTRYGGDTRANLKIFPSPERFFLFGITTSEFGPERKQETQTQIDGNGASTKIETYRDRDTYRFNLQLGRKIQNWAFRGGLIESTGGFGLDYTVPQWGATFTSEIFDYRDEVGINLRLSAEVQIWSVLYGKVMAEELVNDERSFTFLTGLKFNDEDLNNLIGLFL